MSSAERVRKVVLVGGGHSHVQLLKDFERSPLPNADLTVLVDKPIAVYSGMVPGFVAGQYLAEELQIDVRHLAEAARATLVWVTGAVSFLPALALLGVLTSGQSLTAQELPTPDVEVNGLEMERTEELSESLANQLLDFSVAARNGNLTEMGKSLGEVLQATPLPELEAFKPEWTRGASRWAI